MTRNTARRLAPLPEDDLALSIDAGPASLSLAVRPAPRRLTQRPAARNHAAHSFESVYFTWFTNVARLVHALGANEADVEDVTQEIFIIVRRKLGQFDGRDLAGFLYRITERTVRDHRQSAWVRRVFCNLSPLSGLAAPEVDAVDAIHAGEQRRLLDTILAQMSEKRRTTFVLFAIEGYSGEEIAAIQSLPVDTVWTRLHRARKDFRRLAADFASARS